MSRRLLCALCAALCAALWGCGRNYWDDLDERLHDQGTLRVGAIGAFNEPGNVYCPVVTPFLRSELAELDGGHEIVTPETLALGEVVSDIRREQADLFDDPTVARYGRLLGLDVVVVGIVDQHAEDRIWVRAVDVRNGRLFLSGQVKADVTVESELAEGAPAVEPRPSGARALSPEDFVRFFVGELQVGGGQTETVTLDVKQVQPVSPSIVKVKYVLNTKANRQDGEGTISLAERRVRLPGLGYGSFGSDSSGKIVLGSMDRITNWTLTEE